MTYRTGPVTLLNRTHILLELIVSLSVLHTSFDPVMDGIHG